MNAPRWWRATAPYGVAVLLVLALAAILYLVAVALGLPRISTFPLFNLFLIGALAWRYGRGPALAATGAFTLTADYFWSPPLFDLGVKGTDQWVAMATAVLAALAIVQVIHLRKAATLSLERRVAISGSRLHLLETVAPRIVQSLDADEILSTVAQEMHRVIDYHHFRLYRWSEEGERLTLIKSVVRADPYATVDWERLAPVFRLGEGITGLAAQSRQSILVSDGSRDPRLVYPPGAIRLVESLISVPMVAADRLLGVMSVARLGVGSLTIDDQRLMEALAAQTALALANAEQYAGAEQTIRALAAIESLLQTNESGDQLIHREIAQIFADLALAESASLRLLDPRDGLFHLAGQAARSPQPTADDSPPPPALDAAAVAWLAESREPSYAVATQTDPRLPEWAREAARQAGMHTSVFLPLRARNRFLGFIGVHWSAARSLRPTQLSRLQLVAAQAAITLDSRIALGEERGRAKALAELERTRREFMQIASHELRTPLTVIRGYASLLEDGSLGSMPRAAEEALHVLSLKAAEMRVQVERMLFLARLEEGHPGFRMQPVDLKALLREAVGRSTAQVELRQGTATLELAADALPITGDPDRLMMALDNLLQNAVKFSPGPPIVEVSGSRRDGVAEVRIRDHGVGIPAAAQARLFEKFYRVDDARMRNVGGTGIGLYLVRQVVEGHGGTIQVESAPGMGTAFNLRFPLAAEPGQASQNWEARARTGSQSGS